MPLRALIAVLVFAVGIGQAFAADTLGYSEAFDTLYRVDLSTRTATEIGRATPVGWPRFAIIEGLTYSPGGVLYAVSDANSVKTLLTIDPATGLATTIGVLNLTGQNVNGPLDLGMAFTCDGKLWLSSSYGDLWQLNPANAIATYIGNLGVKITGLTAKGSALYGTGGQGYNSLYQIDPLKAQVTLIGPYASANYITAVSAGLDASGQMWTILDYVPPPSGNTVAQWSDLASINSVSGALTDQGPITATGTSVADLQYIGLRGLAIAPNASCAAASAGVASTPTLSWRAMLAMIVLLMLMAGTHPRRRRQNV